MVMGQADHTLLIGVDRLLYGKELFSFHLYKEIPIQDFIYTISRVRVQQEGGDAREVWSV